MLCFYHKIWNLWSLLYSLCMTNVQPSVECFCSKLCKSFNFLMTSFGLKLEQAEVLSLELESETLTGTNAALRTSCCAEMDKGDGLSRLIKSAAASEWNMKSSHRHILQCVKTPCSDNVWFNLIFSHKNSVNSQEAAAHLCFSLISILIHQSQALCPAHPCHTCLSLSQTQTRISDEQKYQKAKCS